MVIIFICKTSLRIDFFYNILDLYNIFEVVYLFQVAVCDDDPAMHKILQHFFMCMSVSESLDFNLQFFLSGEDLIKSYSSQERYSFHIILLDIEMRELSGIETAKLIRLFPDREVQIIFLTNYPEYMLESFEVQAFQYLLKPLTYKLFVEKINKLCHYMRSSVSHFLSVKNKTEHLVLRHSEIIAISKGENNYIHNELCIATDSHNYFISGTLKAVYEQLKYPFVFIHRSIIVNLVHIRKFSTTSVIMSNQQEFPVGRSHAKSLREAYARFIISRFQEG
ncbi:putative response regulatory protein [Paenibacillus polymyxa M1]|uniref:Regulator n=1 Tax=Paenibacillus polymyxa (strain SC2) TaxID=886882 RepID=E3EA09_PAEPS|nr:regulator [Paenibacillus polymyxa SC2]CCI70736.1 putative response regulatory protein [Paenibacillus polymyxa M1]